MRTLLIAAFLAAAPGALAQMNGKMGGMVPSPSMGGMGMTSGMTRAAGQGVVKALDVRAGTVTISHDPIAALGWPAMTMAFKAKPASMLARLSVGEKVKFHLMRMGGSVELTSIGPR